MPADSGWPVDSGSPPEPTGTLQPPQARKTAPAQPEPWLQSPAPSALHAQLQLELKPQPHPPQTAPSALACGSSLAGDVVAWQRVHGRHGLPWQGTRDPYRVWLSEVMLQQTQVRVVLEYFARFLQRFPTVADLAAAPLDEVLASWSGLGYYSRARNLHRCAQAVVQQHGGRFPASSAALAELPGIGRSTAAAIAAFCFGERAAILDGNVKRVLTRALGFTGDLSSAAGERALWAQAQALLPTSGVEAYTQGLMDLGATVCTLRRPACTACPLQPRCVADAQGTPERYPLKTRRQRRTQRSNAWLLACRGPLLWLVQRPPTGVWAGLWSLPEFDDSAALQAAVRAWPGRGQALPPLRHTLTHFDWLLHPLHWLLPQDAGADAAVAQLHADAPGAGRWVTHAQAQRMGLPAPLRKLLLDVAQLASVTDAGLGTPSAG